MSNSIDENHKGNFGSAGTEKKGGVEREKQAPKPGKVGDDESLKKLLWTLTIPITGLLIGLISGYLFLQNGGMVHGPGHSRGISTTYAVLKTGVLFGNMSVLLFLIWGYLRDYRLTGAQFTLGLIFVFSVLFLQNLLAIPFLVQHFGFSGKDLGPFWVLPEALELVALTVLLYLSE